MSINKNVNALRALRRLEEVSSARSQTFERLSSGLRINRAADDAAGLAISSSLSAKSRIYATGMRNLNDGASFLAIADGATGELSNTLVRLTELSIQAANGSISNPQRRSLNKEAQALLAEYNRILDTTQFNGQRVFSSDGSTLHLGSGGTTLSLELGVQQTVGDRSAAYEKAFQHSTTVEGFHSEM